jgi:putative transposase
VAYHYDNAAMESFSATLKQELVYHRQYENRQQAKQDLFDGAARRYIEVWYNRMRRHSSLNYVSPAEYENINHYAIAA